MKWLQFSLRSLLLLLAVAALALLGLRWYLDRLFTRIEKAMDAVWRDSPTAVVIFEGSQADFVVCGLEQLSTATAAAICDAEFIRSCMIDCGSGRPDVPEFDEIRMLDAARTKQTFAGGFAHVESGPGKFEPGTQAIFLSRDVGTRLKINVETLDQPFRRKPK